MTFKQQNLYSDDDTEYSTSEAEEEINPINAANQRLSLPRFQSLENRANIQVLDSAAQNNEKVMAATMLETLGFEKHYIERALQMYGKAYGSTNYNIEMLTEIAVRLKTGNASKHYSSNAFQAYSANPSNKNINQSSSKKRSKSGINRGDLVRYRERYQAEVLETMGDRLQIAWPVSKPLHYRAVLWVHVSRVQREKPIEPKKVKKGIFSGWSKKSKTYAYEQQWTDLIVSASDNSSKSSRPMLKELEPNVNEYTTLKAEFSKYNSGKYEVINIYKVRNEEIAQSHAIRKQRILQFSLDNDANKVNERVLWYPTSMQEVVQLVANGFKRRYRKSSYWGHGHLFMQHSSNAYKSRNCVPDEDGLQYLLYCSVVCGESCLGQPMMKVPTAKPGKNYTMFETSVENVKNPTLFVTFQDDQAIPLYAVVVKRNAKRYRYSKKHGKKQHKMAAIHHQLEHYQMPAVVNSSPVADLSRRINLDDIVAELRGRNRNV